MAEQVLLAPPGIRGQMLRRKPMDQFDGGETAGSQAKLKRSLGTFHLAMIGIGCVVGTGIFFTLSTAVPKAGPAVVVSFVIAGIAAALSALCYAEVASRIPVSGSTYTYAYASLGEFTAVAMGACLLLEYGVSTAASAVGWSGYLGKLSEDVLHVHLPYWAMHAPFTSDGDQHGIVNLPAIVLVFLCGVLLVRGVTESMLVNTIMVLLKLGVLALFGVLALTAYRAGNFADFAPMGVAGITAGSASIFFTFVGVDAVSTAGEEARDPRRTLPRAILIAVTVVIAIYILVAVAAIGAQEWQKFDGQEAGLAVILQNLTGQSWPGEVLSLGAVISIFSVTLVTLYAQTRILLAMGRDGMVSRRFAKISPRTRTPVFNTVLVSVLVALAAAFFPLDALGDLTSIGTLFAFIVVALTVLILRRRDTGDHPAAFRVPGGPVIPVLTVLICGYVIYGLGSVTQVIFVVWLVVALVYYLLWARRHSALNTPVEAEPELVTD
ncbi:amino acid permease [Amycolatopsis sp. CA-230715]|uniref:amino acid permease n=1 Tax=Amycolatopsis sp. CA-230715 TaxID=2745196 RepID=UPI001C01C8AA|nr:amino acid permease [Amycolatopsis sp. CA-230715]QWF83638.1 putative amino acid permease YhdG [Amycolatopsis sp. CA-230715]